MANPQISHYVPITAITTNKIRFGNNAPTAIYKGSAEVLKVYKGSTLVYHKKNTTVGIVVELSACAAGASGTSYLSSSTLSVTSISGNTINAEMQIPAKAYYFQVKATCYYDEAIKYGTNYITSSSFGGSGSWSGPGSNSPFYYWTYTYQPNSSSSDITRGSFTLTNAFLTSPQPSAKITVVHKGTGTTTYAQATVYFCNFYSGTSIQSMSFTSTSSSGKSFTTSTGGGIVGQLDWTNSRELSVSGQKSETNTFSELSSITATSNGTSGGILFASWQIRISTSQPEYSSRQTEGTMLYQGSGEVNEKGSDAVNSVNWTGGNTYYMWFCEY